MRIYSVANSPYFGYNKNLNEEVNKRLAQSKKKRGQSQALLEMNQLCMKLEDKADAAEKTNAPDIAQYYGDLITDAKIVVTNNINERFPDLHYRDKELKWYKNALKDKNLTGMDEYDWRVQIVKGLEESIQIDLEVGEAITQAKKEGTYFPDDEPEPQNAPKPDKTPDTTDANIITNKKVDPKELVELFVPKKYSPQGFVSIAGMDELKNHVNEILIEPLKDPELAKLDEIEYGIEMPRGELLYGASGVGKTYFAEAIAQETGLPMFKFKVSKIGSQFVNGSANNLQAAYEYVRDFAKDKPQPVLIFVDEMESLAAKRDPSGKQAEQNKLVGTFLQILDDARSDNIVIIGATNHRDMIDPAILSRIDNEDYIPVPDDDTRRAVLDMTLGRSTQSQSLKDNPEELEKVVKLTKFFANREIVAMVKDAARKARRDNRRPVIADDFIEPVQKYSYKRITNEDIYRGKNARRMIGFSTSDKN